jgi:hypothetical protein
MRGPGHANDDAGARDESSTYKGGTQFRPRGEQNEAGKRKGECQQRVGGELNLCSLETDVVEEGKLRARGSDDRPANPGRIRDEERGKTCPDQRAHSRPAQAIKEPQTKREEKPSDQ